MSLTDLYRKWKLVRGYKKLAKDLAKDPEYLTLREGVLARRRAREAAPDDED